MDDRMSSLTTRWFEPERLRLARELKGASQLEVARAVRLTPAAISQFESGASRPGTETLRALAALLDVPEGFFDLPFEDTHEGFFRSLRRTSVADRHKARAIGVIAHDIASLTRAVESVPSPTIPRLPVSSLDAPIGEVEALAVQVRRAWAMPTGPIGNVVELLEAHGVLVIRLALDSADVDAFSLPFKDQPVVVLGSDKNDRARSRFDAAHELGHLIMHGDEFWGLAEVERQAHQFAAAFLMPKEDIYEELPTTANWSVLFQLKRKWQVSLAALLMRARTIGRLNETAYLGAVKAASARGWRRVEPVPLGPPEQPKLLARLARSRVLVSSARLPSQVLQALSSASDYVTTNRDS